MKDNYAKFTGCSALNAQLTIPRSTRQLFNLKDDIGEKNDLAAKEPAKMKELETIYAVWDKQMMSPQWVRQDARNPSPRKEEPKLQETPTDDAIAARGNRSAVQRAKETTP